MKFYRRGVAVMLAIGGVVGPVAGHGPEAPQEPGAPWSARVDSVASLFDMDEIRRRVDAELEKDGQAHPAPELSPAETAAVKEIRLHRMVRDYVKEGMFDPKSAEFRNQYGICGEVNTIDRTSGYTGYRHFIAGSKDLVILEHGGDLPREDFEALWDKVCAESPTGAPPQQGASFLFPASDDGQDE